MPLKAKLSCPHHNHLRELKGSHSQSEMGEILGAGRAASEGSIENSGCSHSPGVGRPDKRVTDLHAQLHATGPCSHPVDSLQQISLTGRLPPAVRIPSTTGLRALALPQGRAARTAHPPALRARSRHLGSPLILIPPFPPQGSYSWSHRDLGLGPHPQSSSGPLRTRPSSPSLRMTQKEPCERKDSFVSRSF